MILCLDAGNTRLKCGLFDGGRWRMQGARLRRLRRPGGASLPAADAHRGLQRGRRGGPAAHRGAGRQARASADWLTSTAAACGVSNSYDTPAQLGADRWAALIGARPCMPAPAWWWSPAPRPRSTRSTQDGRFRGGLILPGLALMRAALARQHRRPAACQRPLARSGVMADNVPSS
jgi:type III pantothenate kinase